MICGSGDAPAKYETRKEKFSTKIQGVLLPYESTILSFQRLLVWDNPIYSTLFVFLFHLGFWYLYAHSEHVFGFIFSFILLMVWIDIWKLKIWPEVRAVAPDIDSEWGELNPRLLCIKEMCDILADLLLYLESLYQEVVKVRQNHHGKFCMIFSALCIVLIFIGQRIPGAVFCYILMLCFLSWPLMWYHRFLERAYSSMEPYFMQMQYMLQQRPSDTYQIAKVIANQKSTEKSNDSDEDISEFLPDLDEKTAAVLAKAITDDSELSETDEEILAQELPTFSRASTPEPQIESSLNNELLKLAQHSDTEDDNFGIPAQHQTTTSALSTLLQLPISNEVITNAMSTVMKDTISSMAKSMQPSTTQADGDSAESISSTPVSDYEFVDLSSFEEMK